MRLEELLTAFKIGCRAFGIRLLRRQRGGIQPEEAREGTERRQEAAPEKSDKSRGDEMRARRDERKAIMDEAKDAAEPGTPRRGKKPWWRFWEADEPE